MEKNPAITEKQKSFLEENFRKMKEKELFEKLSELGPALDEKTFAKTIDSLSSRLEEKVFRTAVSEEELEAAVGGEYPCKHFAWENCGGSWRYESLSDCIHQYNRDIYGGAGFANCAATVEDGSWCGINDACYLSSISYGGMKDCAKAWR